MHTDNHFYKKGKKEQFQIQLRIGFVALFINVLFILLAFVLNLYILPFLTIPLTLSIIAPFFDTPSLVKQGKLKYYSSFVLAEEKKGNRVTIHGGTLFDYFFTLDQNWMGNHRTKVVLREFIKGLLNLLEEYESHPDEHVIIRGTTYILSEKTFNKFGFEKVPTSHIQSIIILFNYVNLLVSISFVKRKLSYPRLKNIFTFEGELIQISKNKVYMKSLYNKLREST